MRTRSRDFLLRLNKRPSFDNSRCGADCCYESGVESLSHLISSAFALFMVGRAPIIDMNIQCLCCKHSLSHLCIVFNWCARTTPFCTDALNKLQSGCDSRVALPFFYIRENFELNENPANPQPFTLPIHFAGNILWNCSSSNASNVNMEMYSFATSEKKIIDTFVIFPIKRMQFGS